MFETLKCIIDCLFSREFLYFPAGIMRSAGAGGACTRCTRVTRSYRGLLYTKRGVGGSSSTVYMSYDKINDTGARPAYVQPREAVGYQSNASSNIQHYAPLSQIYNDEDVYNPFTLPIAHLNVSSFPPPITACELPGLFSPSVGLQRVLS